MKSSFSHNGATLMLAPATGFYSTPGLGKNEVRLAYVLSVDAINQAMDCLEVALKEYPGVEPPQSPKGGSGKLIG